jgi:hypothetical protein
LTLIGNDNPEDPIRSLYRRTAAEVIERAE